MCAAIATTGTRERWQSNRPLIRCRLPGPQLPAQTARLAGDMRVGAGREGRDLLVADVQPLDAAMAPQRVGKTVQAVADDAVDPLHAGGGERLDHLVGNGVGHGVLLDVGSHASN